MNKLVLAAAVAALATASDAGTLGNFDDLIIFGDSFSDPGNVYNEIYLPLSQVELPPEVQEKFDEAFDPDKSIANTTIYPNNQWTNGETWASKIGFGYEADPTLRRNWAHGGARSGSDTPFIPDLFEQVAAYSTPTDIGSNPLVTIWIGGNDFLNFKPVEEPGTIAAAEEFEAFVGSIIGGIGQAITDLSATGLKDFLIVGLPDLGTRPFSPNPAGESFASDLYNKALSAAIDGFNTLFNPGGVNVYKFDIRNVIDPLFDEGSGFNTTEACILSNACDPDNFIFWDTVHPTDRVHGIVADAMLDRIQAIPLPAGAPLLLVGLAALGVASRRRVAGRSI